MGNGVPATGIADRLYAGNKVTHLAGAERLHGDAFQLKNTHLLDPVS